MVPVIIYKEQLSMSSGDHFFERLLERDLKLLASELIQYGFEDMSEIDTAVERAMKICVAAAIPIRSNFKRFYISIDGWIVADWLISDLGKKLILINATASNPYVAKIQMALLQGEK